jgi:3D (Asp-Asp-Asp) domain-containing protein
MSNLGSSTTPISGESFDLPSGWSIEENGSNEVVITDSGGNTIGRRYETNGQWVFDSIVSDTLEATDELGNPTYPTLSDVPTNLPEGTQVYVKDENAVFVEDGT